MQGSYCSVNVIFSISDDVVFAGYVDASVDAAEYGTDGVSCVWVIESVSGNFLEVVGVCDY